MPELQDAFLSLSAYCCMYEPRGSVDHFVSIDRGGEPYEWANFRFAQQWLNSTKKDKDPDTWLDPFEVEGHWFEVILPSFQLVLTAEVPSANRDVAMSTLIRLNLIDGEPVVRQREHWFIEYSEDRQNFEGLSATLPWLQERSGKKRPDISTRIRGEGPRIGTRMSNRSTAGPKTAGAVTSVLAIMTEPATKRSFGSPKVSISEQGAANATQVTV